MLLSLVFFWLEIGGDPGPPPPAPHGSAVTCRKTTKITLWTVALCNGGVTLQRSPLRSLHLCVFANSKAPTIFLKSSSLDPSERNCFIYGSEIVSIDPRIFVGTCKRTLLRSRLSGCHATLRRRLGKKQSCSYISPIPFQLTNAMKMRLKGVAVEKQPTNKTNNVSCSQCLSPPIQNRD